MSELFKYLKLQRYLREDIRDKITDIRVYLELIAKCFDIEGDKLDEQVAQKLEKILTQKQR